MNYLKAIWESFKAYFYKDNHNEHFLYAIPFGFFFTILGVFGAATGMEFKDMCYVKNWDWTDWWFTIAGGLVGQALQCGVIWAVLALFG